MNQWISVDISYEYTIERFQRYIYNWNQFIFIDFNWRFNESKLNNHSRLFFSQLKNIRLVNFLIIVMPGYFARECNIIYVLYMQWL